ncbi:TRAP transporter substrate-binding protein [Flagellimonas aequoris]|uniref:TRAP transporter substrate-binding protein n=1 Tax=Flagellimonas aequoris TaxID=2306997 RepID=A0A418N342_9FLAO|nr:TRAP transporter substrate-binding protein [Allomuricauda aequoris]RIV68272.1 TRAP transporter substrate-binding protein [Allomuricauda aequoris]TXJ99963.1 TRAP transporter substrate-binding protein [Allomuricauda aequoris]
MKQILTIFLWGSILLAISCQEVGSIKTIRLAHGLDVNHSVHRAMVKMGEDLENISGGKLKIEIYPNQQLGTEREILELIQLGSLDMTKVSVATLENFAPKTRILGLPYLFESRKHAFEVLDGPIGQALLDNAQQFRLKGLGYYDAGFRSFYTEHEPVNSPDDLKGLKIRVMESVTAMDMVKSLGGSPTPISWGELYTSLQQGVVDGAENNPPSFYLSKHYEVCPYYALDEHTFSPDVLIVGTQFWNQLSEQEQKWVNEAVKRSLEHQRKLWAESEAEALQAVQKAGVKISHPNKEPFIQLTKEMYKAYESDEELNNMIQQIKSMAN